MSKSVLAEINPNILKWAREARGYDLEKLSKVTGISKNTLSNVEQQKGNLTIKQLRKVASALKRPMVVFYYDKTPTNIKLPDFRTVNNDEVEITGELNLKIREIKEKKKWAEKLYEELNENYDYSYVGKYSKSADVKELSREIVGLIKPKEDDLKGKRDNEVLNYWKKKVEGLKVAVFQYSGIDPNLSRGFSFTNAPYPTIAINQKDTYYARVFTLIHELCHILLGSHGICDSYYSSAPKNRIEQLCNSVASEVLVSSFRFSNEIKNYEFSDEEVRNSVSKLSSKFKVSWSVILIKLKQNKIISQGTVSQISNELKAIDLSKYRTKGGGGSFYNNFKSQTSVNYLSAVMRGLNQEIISYYDSMNYLGVSYKVMNEIEKQVETGVITF